MSQPTYDVIVLGTGGVGSAAAMHLAKRGQRVLGIDQFRPPHNLGSSHGQSRVIRQAYFEHADYVPLLRRAYPLWRELEAASGRDLFHQVGLLEVGPPDGTVIPGVLTAAAQHNLDVEQLSSADVAARFPQFSVPRDCAAVFEREAGYLLVEDCVQTHLDQAAAAGAEFRFGERVLSWQAEAGQAVKVRTETETFFAGALVVTAGAWAGQLLASLDIPLRVLRKHLHWLATQGEAHKVNAGMPTFFFELPGGRYFYGFPQLDDRGVKLAEHSGGETLADPVKKTDDVDPGELSRVTQFATQCLPGLISQPTDHTTCLYTMTPDENFIIDRHPVHPQVCLAAGLSGHGFKFATVLGEILADLATEGATSLPIDFLKLSRFQQ